MAESANFCTPDFVKTEPVVPDPVAGTLISNRFTSRRAVSESNMHSSLGCVYSADIELDSQTYALRVYDCEPAGVLVVAQNLSSGTEYTIAPSKRELAAAKITKSQEGYKRLLESLNLATKDDQGTKELVSVLEGIKNTRVPATAGAAADYLHSAPAGKDTLPTLLATGLTELCRQKPVGLNAVEWLGNWLLENNPNQPKVQK